MKLAAIQRRTLMIVACWSAIVYGQRIDLATQIVPILSKCGCNSATCHGSAAGQGGFRLSLFGGDPDFDHQQMVRQYAGRRIDFRQPQHSLLVTKPSGQLEHGGGVRFGPDDQLARLLIQWIDEGANAKPVRMLQRISVQPESIVYHGSLPSEQPLQVEAQFADGTLSDVSPLVSFESLDEAVVQVDSHGRLTLIRPGMGHVLVRFADQLATVPVMIPFPGSPAANSLPGDHAIDQRVQAALNDLNISAAGVANDHRFVRRVYLDLIGRLPTQAQSQAFVNDQGINKRTEMIDSLLSSPEFVEYWTRWFAQLFPLDRLRQDSAAAECFQEWLADALHTNLGWHTIARRLLTSDGDSHQNGAANFYRFAANARDQAELVSETFMGVRLRCANCHNHPLDRWTQDDYHGFAQLFADVQTGRMVRFGQTGEVIHPQTGLPAVRKIPGEVTGESPPNRQQFVEWLLDADNPYFATAMVNRIWAALMGQGLIEPVDDLRSTNPASHPELLQQLADDFVRNDYNVRFLLRHICTSAAYQRDSQLQASQLKYRMQAVRQCKPMPTAVLLDAWSDVTSDASDGPAISKGSVQDSDAATAVSQDVDGCLRDETCVTDFNSIAGQLWLLNGTHFNQLVRTKANALAATMTDSDVDERTIQQLYWATLCRGPSAAELARWTRQLRSTDDANQMVGVAVLEDLLWALLNCHEFRHIY
ncbi:MAG: DUF1549 domain-containing protein [Planctomycetales bacterium]|nr:DUF1549 domain-containing protein [Planctomycetales bacterium]